MMHGDGDDGDDYDESDGDDFVDHNGSDGDDFVDHNGSDDDDDDLWSPVMHARQFHLGNGAS